MWERKIEEPSCERSVSWRRRGGVGNFLGWGVGSVVVVVVVVVVGWFSGVEVVGDGSAMAGDIVGRGCWK